MIRPYRANDAAVLASLYSAVFPSRRYSPQTFHQEISSLIADGGLAWVIGGDAPVGYALAAPVPGLPAIAELKGCIAPSWRRQGFGSALLQRLLAALRETDYRQITYPVSDLDGAAARFLGKHDFYVEHEEWVLLLDDLTHLPEKSPADRASVAAFRREEAVGAFANLFAASFSGLPWDQPYSRQEISTDLDKARDILFLMLDGLPSGFAWLHEEEDGLGVIEPLGVLPAYQGQGYGRYLLQSALHELARRGAVRVQIGAWRTNEPAIHLYQSLGFRHHKNVIYLAYDLASPSQFAV